MNKSKEKKIKTRAEKASAPRPAGKRRKDKTDNAVEELYGVHVIGDDDIENHFGISETKPESAPQRESTTPGESKNKK